MIFFSFSVCNLMGWNWEKWELFGMLLEEHADAIIPPLRLAGLGGLLSICKFLDLGRRDEGFERKWEVWCHDLSAQAERLCAGRGCGLCLIFSKGSICLLRVDDTCSGYSRTEIFLISQVWRDSHLDVLLEQSNFWFDLRQQDHSSHWVICQLRILHFLSGFTLLHAFSFSCALRRNCFPADKHLMLGKHSCAVRASQTPCSQTMSPSPRCR